MSQKFHTSVHQRDDISIVRLAGVIDEDNELSELTGKIGVGTVIIDLGEVERINSCGVRDWVNWLTSIEADNVEVVLVECSPAIVAQINLVNNFTGKGTVKSFYVPYFCSQCDEEKVLLCEAGDMGAPPHEPPVCRCDECDQVMDFDDMPDSYFAFLLSQKKLSNTDHLQTALTDYRAALGSSDEKSKVRSRVGSRSGSVPGRSLPSVSTLPSIGSQTLDGGVSATQASSAATEPRSNVLLFAAAGAIVATIVTLAYLFVA